MGHLTRDALGTIDLAALAPVKKLLKRFFSDEGWTADDDEALAGLVGAGTGWWRRDLDDEFGFDFGWRDGAFRMEAAQRRTRAETFAGPVVPEATPNPRTIRFVTPPLHSGPSRWYESAVDVDDTRVARLFTEFDDIANVLVGPEFVAVGLRRPDRWEALLDAVLAAITSEFASKPSDLPDRDEADAGAPSKPGTPLNALHAESPNDGGGGGLEQAWKELGALRPDASGDLDRIVAATSSTSGATRQVAARLLADADADVAELIWGRLLGDSSRGVRRAVVDAMVDVERAALRPLLERALRDADAWTRWKALRGLVGLGIEPSRAAVIPLGADPDFRVRLEAASALP